MELNGRSDEELLAALRQGEESAFDALFRTHYAALCRYAMRINGGEKDEAEDVVQQVFIKIWEQRATLEIKWTPKAYFYKMVHNRCLNRIRDARNRKQKLDLAGAQQPLFEPETPVADEELTKALQRALDKLPPQCRQIFELSRFEALKYREIADQLNLSVKTVEAQMGKALRLMRIHLADFWVWLLLFFFKI